MTSPAPAPPAVAAAFAELFDDAGLFPPAALPMDAAVDGHRLARHGGFSWMLGRFVCPASRLAELAEVAPRFGSALRLTVVVDDDGSLGRVAEVVDEHGWRVEAVEARLRGSDVEAAAQQLRVAARTVGAADAFLEVPVVELPDGRLEATVRAMRAAEVGMKLRCGGADAIDFPSPALVASVIAACATHGSPLKATAGLHHPFRHPEPGAGAMAHGFVNLIAAAALATRDGANASALAEVVADGAGGFDFEDDALVWRSEALTTPALVEARQRVLVAIGSCSFREPVDDLVALGALPVP